MKLPIIDQAIEECQRHLVGCNASGTQIESFLTRYLLILISAAFEEEIERIVVTRAARAGDPHITAFVQSAIGNVFRSVKTSEIAGLLKRFGGNYKDEFQAKLDPKTETFFNNIIINRHKTAHESGSDITMIELIQFYEEGHKVLDVLIEVIK
jgi:hypothetical protein